MRLWLRFAVYNFTRASLFLRKSWRVRLTAWSSRSETLMPAGYVFGSSWQRTFRPALVVVAAINSTMT
jgi:hypothetical protein